MEARLPVWLDARRIGRLLALGLESEDFEALTHGGFVCGERRGERTLFKLRFRRDGRQRVVSLGSDARRALAIREELDLLQSLRRIGQLLREVNRALTEADRIWHTQVRLRLVPYGVLFRGYYLRNPRAVRQRGEALWRLVLDTIHQVCRQIGELLESRVTEAIHRLRLPPLPKEMPNPEEWRSSLLARCRALGMVGPEPAALATGDSIPRDALRAASVAPETAARTTGDFVPPEGREEMTNDEIPNDEGMTKVEMTKDTRLLRAVDLGADSMPPHPCRPASIEPETAARTTGDSIPRDAHRLAGISHSPGHRSQELFVVRHFSVRRPWPNLPGSARTTRDSIPPAIRRPAPVEPEKAARTNPDSIPQRDNPRAAGRPSPRGAEWKLRNPWAKAAKPGPFSRFDTTSRSCGPTRTTRHMAPRAPPGACRRVAAEP